MHFKIPEDAAFASQRCSIGTNDMRLPQDADAAFASQRCSLEADDMRLGVG
jgi:hypothetical protein